MNTIGIPLCACSKRRLGSVQRYQILLFSSVEQRMTMCSCVQGNHSGAELWGQGALTGKDRVA